MDDVFGNSSGETVVESPQSSSLIDQSVVSDSDHIVKEEELLKTDQEELRSDNDKATLNNNHNDDGCLFEMESKGDQPKVYFDCDSGVYLGEFAVKEDSNEELPFDDDMKLKKKLVDLDATQDLQMEQNSENHHLEEMQKQADSDFQKEDHIYFSEKCFDDICKSPDLKAFKMNSSLEDYLTEFKKQKDLQKYMKNIHDSTIGDYFNDINAKSHAPGLPNYQKSPRNTVYQLPPMRHSMSSAPSKVSPHLQKSKILARPRAHTTASLAARHLYQNLPFPVNLKLSPVRPFQPPTVGLQYTSGIHTQPPSPKTFQAPVYVNVPAPRSRPYRGSPQQHDTLLNPANMRNSYIQLWSGGKHDSLSDTECDDVRKHDTKTPKSFLKSGHGTSSSPRSRQSSPGYVQMTSPYVRSPVSSVFAQLSSSLATYAGHAPQTIFCPLCPRQFSYERTLASHIQRTHRLELEAMIDGRPGDLALQCCPICQARFFNSSVLPKHLIDCHKESLIQLLEKHRCIKSGSNGMQCPFCIKSVPAGINGEHMLIFHLQQYHLTQYQDMINGIFKAYSSATNSGNGISDKDVKEIFGFDPGASSTPGLSGKMGALAVVSSDSKRKLEDVEKEEHGWTLGPIKEQSSPKEQVVGRTPSGGEQVVGRTPKNYEKQEPRRSVSKGILRREKSSSRPNVKRELRFSVPHVTKEEIYYPESPGPITPDYRERLELNTFAYLDNNCPSSDVVADQPFDMDAITSEEFIDMNQQMARKRRRIGLSIRSKRIFKCREKENQSDKTEMVEPQHIYATASTRTFRRPKPVAPPRVPTNKLPGNGSPCAAKFYSTCITSSTSNQPQNQHTSITNHPTGNLIPARSSNPQSHPSELCHPSKLGHNAPNQVSSEPSSGSEPCPFSSSLKLYSPLRLFRCNGCRYKFCDNDSLLVHISQQHRGLLSLLRPQFGCGVCAAKFYENKYLVKHCLQHHTSLLEIRSASGEQIPVLGAGGGLAPSGKGKLQQGHHLRAGKPPVTAL